MNPVFEYIVARTHNRDPSIPDRYSLGYRTQHTRGLVFILHVVFPLVFQYLYLRFHNIFSSKTDLGVS